MDSLVITTLITMNDSWRDLKRNGFIFKSRIRKTRFLLLVRGLLNNQFSTSRSASKEERRIHVYFDSGSKEEERSVIFLSFSLSFFPFCVCLFFSFFAIYIFSFYSYLFWFIRIFPSAFYYPHFCIRIRHPQVSGPRFTDTPFNDSQNSRAAEPLCNERNTQPYEI